MSNKTLGSMIDDDRIIEKAVIMAAKRNGVYNENTQKFAEQVNDKVMLGTSSAVLAVKPNQTVLFEFFTGFGDTLSNATIELCEDEDNLAATKGIGMVIKVCAMEMSRKFLR